MTEERNELKDCIEVLLGVGAIGRRQTGKKEIVIINPKLVFISPVVFFLLI
jgi:hypothetical protein